MRSDPTQSPGTEGAYCIELVDETGERAGHKCEPRDGRLDIARRLYRALCAQYSDRQITLCDGDGRFLDGYVAGETK
jgi:hypothetical protein